MVVANRWLLKLRIESQHFAQAFFHHLLIRALPSAIEPALEFADASPCARSRAAGRGWSGGSNTPGNALVVTWNRSGLLPVSSERLPVKAEMIPRVQ